MANEQKAQNGRGLLDLFGHARSYLVGEVAVKALGIISLPVLTRLLSPSEYGTLAVFASYFTLLHTVLSLNTHTVVARYFYDRTDDFPAFLRTTLFVSLGVLLTSFGILSLFYDWVRNALDLPGHSLLLLLILTFAFTWSAIYRQVLVSQQQSRQAAIWPIVRGYVGFALGVALILPLSETRYYGPMAARVLVEVALGAYFVRKLWALTKTGGPSKRAHVYYILSYGLPLIPYSISGQILGQFDRIMINGTVGAAATGIYSVGYNVAALMLMVIVPLRTALTPELFALQNEQRHDAVDRLNAQMLEVTAAFGVLLIVFAREIISLLAPSSYSSAIAVVAPVTIGYLFHALSGVYGQYGHLLKRTGYLSVTVLVAGAANVLLNLYYLPLYGPNAAAYTTLASYVISGVLAWAIAKWILQAQVTSLRITVKPLLVTCIATVAVAMVDDLELSWPATIAIKLVVCAPAMLWLVPPTVFNLVRRSLIR